MPCQRTGILPISCPGTAAACTKVTIAILKLRQFGCFQGFILFYLLSSIVKKSFQRLLLFLLMNFCFVFHWSLLNF